MNTGYSFSYDKKPNKSIDKMNSNKFSDWIEISVDEMTNDTTFRSKELLSVSNVRKEDGFIIRMEKSGYDGSPWILFNTYGSGNCIDNDNRIIILFTDKSKIDTQGSSKFNCNNNSWLYLGSEYIEDMKNKNIEKVRVYTMNGSVEETFTPKQSEEFRVTFKYLIDLK
jgi:hypothetical protein